MEEQAIRESVQQFYDSAWNMLVFTTSAVLVVISVVAPTLMARSQNSVLRQDRERLEALIKERVEK